MKTDDVSNGLGGLLNASEGHVTGPGGKAKSLRFGLKINDERHYTTKRCSGRVKRKTTFYERCSIYVSETSSVLRRDNSVRQN